MQKASGAAKKDDAARKQWQEVRRSVKPAASGSGAAASSSRGGSSRSAATLAPAPKQGPPRLASGRSCWAHAQVRKLCPHGDHIKISRETKFAKRWRGEVSGAQPPNQVSCKFDEPNSATEQAAIVRMLLFLWSVEDRERGHACPWDFESLTALA